MQMSSAGKVTTGTNGDTTRHSSASSTVDQNVTAHRRDGRACDLL